MKSLLYLQTYDFKREVFVSLCMIIGNFFPTSSSERYLVGNQVTFYSANL